MRSTAGTAVIPRNFYNTYLTLDLDLTPIFYLRQFLLLRIMRKYFQVFPHSFICLRLDPAKFLFCDLTVKVHRTVLTAKMEADIIIPVCGVDQP